MPFMFVEVFLMFLRGIGILDETQTLLTKQLSGYVLGVLFAMTSYTIANNLGKEYKLSLYAPGIAAVIVFTSRVVSVSKPINGMKFGYFDDLQTVGIFSAVILALLSINVVRLISYLFKFKDKETSRFNDVLFGIVLGICLVLILKVFFSLVGSSNLYGLLINISEKYAYEFSKFETGYFMVLGISLITVLLGTIGINASVLFAPSLMMVSETMLIENSMMVEMGQKAQFIPTPLFFQHFVWLGGQGVVMAIAMLMIKNKRKQKLGKVSLLPSLFNINVPVLFGLPILFNPVILIPHFLVTFTIATISYFSMHFGLVPPTYNVSLKWITPIVISGYLSTGSIMGSVLQIINIGVAVVIYGYFFKRIENCKN